MSDNYRCQLCGCIIYSDDQADLEEALWEHIQSEHPMEYEEVQDWDTLDMINELYEEEY